MKSNEMAVSGVVKKDRKKKINLHSLTLYIGAVLIFVVFTILCSFDGKNFISFENVTNIIVQSSIIAIVAIGSSVVVLTGGIDLSVGANAGFTGMVLGMLVVAGLPIWASCILSLAVGLGFGLLNGVGISFGKVPAFIMTLGMQGILRGASLAINDGMPVAGFPPELGDIANTTIFGLPIFIVYVLVLYVVMVVVMNKTKFGRYIYAIGGNVKAARLSGINTTAVEISAYCLTGVFSALGGIFLLSRLLYASPTAGTGYELDAIAAAVIGGIALSGGSGKIYNTLVGALILGTLKAGLQMLNVSSAIQQMAIGCVIILAVFFDKGQERKAE